MLHQHVNPTVLKTSWLAPVSSFASVVRTFAPQSLQDAREAQGSQSARIRARGPDCADVCKGATHWRLGPIKMCDLLLSYLEDVSFNLSEHAALRRPVWQIWRMRWWTAGNQALVLSSAIRWQRHTVVTQANAPTGMFIRHACAKGMDGHVYVLASCPALAAYSIWCRNHKKTWCVF